MLSKYAYSHDSINSYIDLENNDDINTILMESITNTHIFDKTLLINGTQLVIPSTNVQNLYDTIHNNDNSQVKSYSFLLKLLYDLSIQLKYFIETHKKCYIGLSPKDVMIINNSSCFCINKDLLFDIHKNNIVINNPFEKNGGFFAPEILDIKNIPATVDYKCSYYSLGLIIIYIMNPSEEKCNIDILKKSYLINTDLYYMIRRCLQPDISRRSIIYI